MSASQTYEPPTALKIEECALIIEMVRRNPYVWSWGYLVHLLDRLERLIKELRDEFRQKAEEAGEPDLKVECPVCHPSGGERYRSGEDIRQKEDGSLVCLGCGRVVVPPEHHDVT